MRAATAVIVATAVIAGCTKQYKVRVVLRPEAGDRRIASGKSDVVEGFVKGGDATNLYIDDGGTTESVPRADVAEVDQHDAKRDVRFGIVFGVLGAALAVGGAIAFDCGESDFPLFCPFHDKRNFVAGLAFVGGIALVLGGVEAYIQGSAGQSRTDEALRGRVAGGWHVMPAIAIDRGGGGAGTIVPGLGVAARF